MASIQEDVCHLPEQRSSTQVEDLHWEEMYHKWKLMYNAINAIINRVGPELK